MENPIDDLTFIQQIAPCKYGNVYLTSKQGSSIQYCTKIIDRNVIDKNKSEKKFLEKEISILKDLNHPNIIKLIETKETEDKYYIVTEYYNGGNLEQYINVYKHLYHRNLPEKIVQYTKESGFTEIQKEDILISLLYGFYYKEYIPNAPIQRLIKTTKAEKVSPDAVETLAVEIEKKIISILEKIEELSAKNKQKDINLEDIQKVLK